MKLHPHQIEALKITEALKTVAYYMEMGLGKTHTASEKFFEIGNKIGLVICQKSKVTDWILHFQNNYPNVFIVDYTKKRNQKLSAIDITSYSSTGHVVVIVNYELAWRRPELSKLREFTLILDESSMIQNPETKITKFIMKKLNQDATILLSGTPVGGKFENLWSQLSLLGCDMTKKEFEDRFINFEKINVKGIPFPVKIVHRKTPYKNIDELKSILRNRGAVFMKTEDVIDLPEQRIIKVFNPLNSDYRKFLKSRVIEIGDRELVGNTSLSYRLGLRMLASGYSKAKIESFRDLIQSTSDRLIVFYNFNHELEALRRIAEEQDRPISIINGKEKNLEAYIENDDSITFVQYQAGAMGLNLQLANKVIYFSLPERSELFEQSKKRIHRIGQKNACTYYVMMSASSIDELIYRALEQKRDYTDELFREQYVGKEE